MSKFPDDRKKYTFQKDSFVAGILKKMKVSHRSPPKKKTPGLGAFSFPILWRLYCRSGRSRSLAILAGLFVSGDKDYRGDADEKLSETPAMAMSQGLKINDIPISTKPAAKTDKTPIQAADGQKDERNTMRCFHFILKLMLIMIALF